MDHERFNDNIQLPAQSAHGYFELDHAREELVRQVGDVPLGVPESRLVQWALYSFDVPALEALARLLALVRADGPL